MDNSWFTSIMDSLGALCTTVVGKVLLAALVFIVGKLIIKWVLKLIGKCEHLLVADAAVRSITASGIKIALYVLLSVSVVGILGVPMASITAVVAAGAAAIGLAMQGTLSSFASGMLILIFRPFGIGDYISAAGTEGTVKNISIFFTTLDTADNKRITVPNSSIMGGTITNYSAEKFRRMDIAFKAPVMADSALVLDTLRTIAQAHPLVTAAIEQNAPAAPAAMITGAGDGTVDYAVRLWCATGDYWTVYFDLLGDISQSLMAKGVKLGVKQLMMESDK